MSNDYEPLKSIFSQAIKIKISKQIYYQNRFAIPAAKPEHTNNVLYKPSVNTTIAFFKSAEPSTKNPSSANPNLKTKCFT